MEAVSLVKEKYRTFPQDHSGKRYQAFKHDLASKHVLTLRMMSAPCKSLTVLAWGKSFHNTTNKMFFKSVFS